MQKESGITLLEMLIAITIAILLTGIGISNLFAFNGRNKLNSETDRIVSLMRNAQQRSINQENSARFGVSLVNKTPGERDEYVLFQVDESQLASSSYSFLPGTALETRTVNQALEIFSPAEGVRENVIFSKITGQTTSTTVIIQMDQNTSTQKTIGVYSNGRIERSE